MMRRDEWEEGRKRGGIGWSRMWRMGKKRKEGGWGRRADEAEG